MASLESREQGAGQGVAGAERMEGGMLTHPGCVMHLLVTADCRGRTNIELEDPSVAQQRTWVWTRLQWTAVDCSGLSGGFHVPFALLGSSCSLHKAVGWHRC